MTQLLYNDIEVVWV